MDKKLRRKLYMIRYHIIERCYNKEHERYPLYGGKGVYMCDEWHDLKVFYQSIQKVIGYDEKKILKGEIHLDKDSLIEGNKIYSERTCVFITKEKNNKYKPNQMKKIKCISPDGIEYTTYNQSEFAREIGIPQWGISACLIGRQKSYKGWYFYYI